MKPEDFDVEAGQLYADIERYTETRDEKRQRIREMLHRVYERARSDESRAQRRGTPLDVEERFFAQRLRDGSRDHFKHNPDGTYTMSRYFYENERIEAMARVARVLNDRRGFHVDTLDDEIRGALLGAIVGAVLEL